ncbi:protein NETWORKED 3C-like [Aristolochia californica]|uniref:protein NETWORKED 3C-like n=1 Tax=Aristolochia californica TaxID=171875 RepID=UPI0035E391B7
MMLLKKPSYSWWFDSHISPRRSPWLQSTLSELDEKTKAMVKLIEEDADSFAQRAEMYYKKRPELVNMVEDFYRAHRSLAEKYDQLKSEAGARVVPTQLGSPLSKENSAKHLKCASDKSSVASSDSFDSEESEIDDPDQEETQVDQNIGEEITSIERVECLTGNGEGLREGRQHCFAVEKDQLSNMREEIEKLKEANTQQWAEIMQKKEEQATKEALKARDSEVWKLKEEIDKLKEQNRMQKAELSERNEEKKEVIRQLSLSINILKEENTSLRKHIKDSKKKSLTQFSKWKESFPVKFFNLKCQPSIVAL